jgi:hypothetical protein
MGEGFNGFTVYDISTPTSPILLSSLNVMNDADDFIVTNDLEIIVIANGVLGVTMVDFTDKNNPFILTDWLAPNSASVENVDFYHNETFVIVSMRFFGFAILEIDSSRTSLI